MTVSASTGIVPPPPPGSGGANACGWAERFGDASEQEVLSLALEPGGDIVVGGDFDGTLDLGAGPMRSSGTADLGDSFVARFTSTGALVYQRQIVTNEDGELRVVAAPNGDTFIFGDFGDDADFGGGVRVTSTTAGYDAFFGRIDAAGDVVFVERVPDANGPPTNRDALGMTLSPSGDATCKNKSLDPEQGAPRPSCASPPATRSFKSRTAPVAPGMLIASPGFDSVVALPGGGVALSITYFGYPFDDATIDFGDGVLAVVPPGQASAAFVAVYDDAGTAQFVRSFAQADGPDGPSGYDVGLGVGDDGTIYLRSVLRGAGSACSVR